MTPIKSLLIVHNGKTVGKLGLNAGGLSVFEYDTKFLSEGFSISPFELPLKPGVFTAQRFPFEGGFGVFDDSLPDGWGLLILDRYLRSRGIDPMKLTLLDRLALVGSKGRGALEFYPDKSDMTPMEYSDFNTLSVSAQEILGDKCEDSGKIEEFQQRGGSPGGARPKIFVCDDGYEWLVKFRARYDSENIGETEYRYSILAKECGIEMPPTRLFDNKFFGVRRFDRKDDRKLHVVSVAGLLRADYRAPSIDYMHIFKIANSLCHDIEDTWKIYRLMLFNFLIGNKDDHAKNFSFIHDQGEWHFAPAYDLLPSSGFNGYHTTTFNNNLNPQKKDLINIAGIVGLDTRKAESTFDFIQDQVTALR